MGSFSYMQFSDTTNNTGILQDARRRVGLAVGDGAFATSDVVRWANRWYYKAVLEAWRSSSDWEFDDSNLTTDPIATQNLTNDTSDYALPTGSLKIKRIEILDNSSNWLVLKPIIQEQIGVADTEFHETDGLPKFWRHLGRNRIRIYPAPDNGVSVTLTNGLRIYFLREVDEFTASDTTQEPGLVEPFHHILSVGAAYDFAVANDMKQAAALRNELNVLFDELRAYYSGRNQALPPKIKPRVENYF